MYKVNQINKLINKKWGEIMYMSSFGIPIVSKIEGGTFEDLKKSIIKLQKGGRGNGVERLRRCLTWNMK